jgi:hypothetical protein
MVRWKTFVLGALAFLAAHGVLVAMWQAWFEPAGAYPPWFLNSGRAVAFVAVTLVAASALSAIVMHVGPTESLGQGSWFGAGAAAAMTVVLFSSSPGTLFPIALAVGAGIAVASGVLGTAAGGALGSSVSRR